jgi:hypothetical protein
LGLSGKVIAGFIEKFSFILNQKEFENLRSHIGTSSWGGTK